MPVVKFTISQIEKMLVTRSRDAATCLGVQDIVDPNKGFSIRTCWHHLDDEGKANTNSENFNPYRSWIEVNFEERF